MQRNVAGQSWVVFAFQDEGGANPGEPVTGDAANITANLRLDGGAANAVDDTNPTELEDGYYVFTITAAESNADNIVICPASSTANVNVIGVPGALYTTPANFNDLAVTASTGRVDVASVAGTAQTANDNGADINTLLTNLATTDGKVDTVDGLIDTLVARVPDTVSLANINAQVADVLTTDTVTEMAQGAPPVAPTIEQMINYLYREWVRNRVVIDTDTANQKQVFADDDSTILYEKDLTNASDVTTIAKATTGA